MGKVILPIISIQKLRTLHAARQTVCACRQSKRWFTPTTKWQDIVEDEQQVKKSEYGKQVLKSYR